jgi:hypothetical protein
MLIENQEGEYSRGHMALFTIAVFECILLKAFVLL